MSVTPDRDSDTALKSVKCFYGTDVGRCREENQDTLGIIERERFKVFLVADGMGGVKGGSIASRLAVDVLTNAFEDGSDISGKALVTATNHANSVIFEKGMDDNSLTGMGTTLVGLGFCGTKMWILNVGDSRAYRIRDSNIKQLTIDHTLISELLKSGAITIDQVSNHPVSHMLTRSLGPTSTVEVDCGLSKSGPIAKDLYLLCSDGLYNHVSDSEILKIVSEFGPSEDTVDQLIKRANQRGGTDNITVVLVEIDEQYPVTSVDELEGDEDPFNTSTLEMQVDSSANENESTLEMEAKIRSDSSAVHRDRLLNRYRHIYNAVTDSNLPPAQPRLVKVRFLGTLMALLLVMVGSYQLGFLFAGSSKSRMIGQFESSTNAIESAAVTEQIVLATSRNEDPYLVTKDQFRWDFKELKGRLSEIELNLERLDRYLMLAELPDKAGIEKLLEKNDQSIEDLETDLIGVRAELDVVTRELALWYGRRQRIKDIDGLRIAKEVAAASNEVRSVQKEFEEVTWAYLNAAERSRYNPKDQSLRKEVFKLKEQRLELREALKKLIEQEIIGRIDKIDNRVAQLTISRDSIERELSHLKEEKVILEKIKLDKPNLLSEIVRQISEERETLKAEQSELKRLLVR